MASLDPTQNLDTLPEVTVTQLDEASTAYIPIIVDGRPYRLDAAELLQTVVTATTTTIEDATVTLNTVNKYAGKQVWNTTTGVLCIADGSGPTDTWSEADGTVEHTPS